MGDKLTGHQVARFVSYTNILSWGIVAFMNDYELNNTQLNTIFQTADLSLAATLSLWYPIEEIDKTILRKAQFLFKRCDRLDELVESYWRRELTVEPQSFFNQLKAIKARLYE